MKLNFSTVLGSTLVATGFVSMMAAAPASAKPKIADEPPTSEILQSCTAGLELVGLGTILATDCEGAFEGNDTNSSFLTDLNSGSLFENYYDPAVTWSLAAKSDDPGSWLTAPGEEEEISDGTWGFTLPSALNTASFILNLKAGNSFSSYLFKDFNFNGVTSWSGVFNTIGVSLAGNGTEGKALSHASLYLASGGSTVPDPTPVPEPATLLGLAVVGGGISLSRRRKSASC
ncbi:MAG TPA: PEP-CTERM sorting domain-containing protein [Vampirovibrionales bacterium]